MRHRPTPWSALALVLAACAGDVGDGSGTEEIVTETSSTSCTTQWSCVDDTCECTGGPSEGSRCVHPDDSSDSDNCDDLCEVCT